MAGMEAIMVESVQWAVGRRRFAFLGEETTKKKPRRAAGLLSMHPLIWVRTMGLWVGRRAFDKRVTLSGNERSAPAEVRCSGICR
jgi:hypothetical protein